MHKLSLVLVAAPSHSLTHSRRSCGVTRSRHVLPATRTPVLLLPLLLQAAVSTDASPATIWWRWPRRRRDAQPDTEPVRCPRLHANSAWWLSVNSSSASALSHHRARIPRACVARFHAVLYIGEHTRCAQAQEVRRHRILVPSVLVSLPSDKSVRVCFCCGV